MKLFCTTQSAIPVRGLIVLLAAILSGSLNTLAQTESASVSGRVTDQSGAVVAGAEVEIRNVDTGVSQVTTTDRDGFYSLPALKPGEYVMNVHKESFRTVSVTGMTLSVQEKLSRNFSLQVGSVAESITITAEAATINETDASVSTVVDQSYVKNMPLNGRSFQDLILLTPGVVTSSPQLAIGGTNLGYTGEFSVNGQRTEANYFAVDGVSANLGVTPGVPYSAGTSGSVEGQTALGTTQALVSVDDLQEFRVSSSTYSAEHGRNPGGQIAFETKSGTNQWHGTGFDYLRNDYFAANDWFNDYLNVKQPALRQNDFGGTLGGPVRIPGVYHGKDKTFFFVSYEGLRLQAPQPASTDVLVPDLCVRGVTSACPSDGSITPAATALQPVMKAFPLPTPGAPDNGGFQNFFGSWSNPSSLNSTSVRFDHVIKDKARLFFRFSNTSSSSATRFMFTPQVDQITGTTTRTYTGGATSLFSSRLSNDVRVNYSTNEVPQQFAIVPFAGSSFVDMRQLSGIGAGGTANFGWCCLSENANLYQGMWSAWQGQWNLVDTVSLSVGRHQFKFGVDYRRLMPHVTQFNPSVTYYFQGCDPNTGLCTGSLLDAALTNNTAAFIGVGAASPAYPLYQNFSAFGQDEWKITPRLTLSMGLRWEVNPPPGVTRGLMPYTAQGLSDFNTAYAAPQGTPLYHTTWFNFAPRLGAAYVLHSAPGRETVVRAGGGVFYDTGNQNGSFGFSSVGFSSGNFLSGAFPVNVATDPNPNNNNQPGLVNPINQPCNNNNNPNPCPQYNLTAFYPHLQLPYTWQWNASVEQQLGKSQALSLMFVGSHASRLIQYERVDTFGNPNANPPIPANPSLSGLNLIFNGLTADYDSLQAQFTRRLSQGLTSMASYTWSHCIDYGSYNYDFEAQRGNCAFDVRHNFSGAFSYDLPIVGHSGLLRALADDWGVDDRFTARTAFPIDLNGNGSFLPNGQLYDQGLSFVPGQPVYLYGANCTSVLTTGPLPELQSGRGCPGGKALNPNAFENAQCPAANPFCRGNVPRNFARLFGAWQMDLAVRREFPLYENLKLQFRAEAFNVFNHPNFGAVDGNCLGSAGTPGCFGYSGTFGLAQSTLATSLGVLSPQYQMGGPRSMQFALKLIF